MEALVFISYLLIFSILIVFIPFFHKSSLSKLNLIFLFFLKISAGIGYALFYKLPKYYAGSDTWRFYRQSIVEKKWLLTDPIAFTKDIFVYGYHSTGKLFGGENSYWNDLKSNVPIKLMAIMNVLTNDSYYTNIILFNFLFFVGLVALFKVFIFYFPENKISIIIGVFLLPSTLFWCSGVHKDGLILSALGAFIYIFHRCLQIRFSIARILYMLLCALVLFSLRNYLLFALLLALACWYFATKFKRKYIWVFTVPYFSLVLIALLLTFTHYSISPFNILAEKQHEFLQLSGSSAVINFQLQPTMQGILHYLPYAIDMGFFRPHLTEVNNLAYIPSIIESILFFIIILSSIFIKTKRENALPFTCFLLFFSISIIMICGFTIPLTGAIVRYKSLILPLFITPFLCKQKLIFLKK